MNDEPHEKMRQTMVEKYGGEEGYKKEMKRRAVVGGRKSRGGGFAALPKEQLIEISRKAAHARWNKKDSNTKA